MQSSSQQKINQFFQSSSQINLEKGDIAFEPCEKINHLLLIEQGQISQYDIAPNGNKVVIEVYDSNDITPLSLALSGYKNQYYFEATTETIAYKTSLKKLIDFLEDNPDVAFSLLRVVSKKSSKQRRRMAHMMGGNAKSRLLFEILNASEGPDSKKTGEEDIIISMTVTNLAKRSGLSRETVSRTLSLLKNEHQIRVGTSQIIVTNIKSLEDALGLEL